MGPDSFMFLMNDMLWVAAIVAAPILLSTLVVGVLISVIQVATQIQEMTISYVPKLAIAAVILILLGGWMMGRISDFARESYASILTIQ